MQSNVPYAPAIALCPQSSQTAAGVLAVIAPPRSPPAGYPAMKRGGHDGFLHGCCWSSRWLRLVRTRKRARPEGRRVRRIGIILQTDGFPTRRWGFRRVGVPTGWLWLYSVVCNPSHGPTSCRRVGGSDGLETRGHGVCSEFSWAPSSGS